MIECCSSILEKDSSVLFSKNLAAMVALSRCLGSLALFVAGAEGARISRKGDPAPSTKFIAGVPVLNYHTAYEGKGSLGELESEEEQEWVILVKPGTTDAQVQRMCKTNKNGCNLNGHMDGGVPFLELRGTERDLEVVLKSAEGAAKYVEPDAEVRMIPELEVNVEASTWGLTRIGADQRGSSGAGATVFVLDTGVRVSHREFSGRAGAALDMTSGSQVVCSGDSSCAADAQGHGTHCAGTAAGASYGVAPTAAVRAIKVLGDDGSGSWSWSYSALDWLATSRRKHEFGRFWHAASHEGCRRRSGGCWRDSGGRGRELQCRRLWFLTSLHPQCHHCGINHLDGQPIFLLKLWHLHQHLGPRQRCGVCCAHLRHRQPQPQWHFDGLPPCLWCSSSVAGGQSQHECVGGPCRVDQECGQGCHLRPEVWRCQRVAVRGSGRRSPHAAYSRACRLPPSLLGMPLGPRTSRLGMMQN